MRLELYIAEEREKAHDEGRKEAHDEEQRLNAALAAALVSRGREDEAVAVLLDPQVREKLLDEFGIE